MVDNPGHRLKAEMFAKIDIETPRTAKLIAVPSKAVLNDGDKSMVIVATEGNIFRTRRGPGRPRAATTASASSAGLTPRREDRDVGRDLHEAGDRQPVGDAMIALRHPI